MQLHVHTGAEVTSQVCKYVFAAGSAAAAAAPADASSTPQTAAPARAAPAAPNGGRSNGSSGSQPGLAASPAASTQVQHRPARPSSSMRVCPGLSFGPDWTCHAACAVLIIAVLQTFFVLEEASPPRSDIRSMWGTHRRCRMTWSAGRGRCRCGRGAGAGRCGWRAPDHPHASTAATVPSARA